MANHDEKPRFTKAKCAFYYDGALTTTEVVQYTLLSPLLLVRFILVVITVLCCGLYCLCISWVPNHWKRIAIKPASMFARILLIVLGFYHIPVHGRKACGTGPKSAVVVSNHTTFLDAVILLWEMAPSFISKESMLHVPVIGAICRALGVIGVVRESKHSRGGTRAKMKAHAEQFPKVSPMLVFPEGTTTRENTIIKFKTGAFSLGLPVQPVLLIFHKRSFDVCNVVSTPMKVWTLRMLGQFRHVVSLHYLDVCEPTAQERENPPIFAARVRQLMARELDKAQGRVRCVPRPLLDVTLSDMSTTEFFVWKDLIEVRKPPVPVSSILGYSIDSLRANIVNSLTGHAFSTKEVEAIVEVSIGKSQFTSIASVYADLWHLSPSLDGKLSDENFSKAFGGEDGDGVLLASWFAQLIGTTDAAVSQKMKPSVGLLDFATALLLVSPSWLSSSKSDTEEQVYAFVTANQDNLVEKWVHWFKSCRSGKLENHAVDPMSLMDQKFFLAGKFFVESSKDSTPHATVDVSHVLLQASDAAEDSSMNVA